jgi:hypothetical protein
MKSLVVFDGTRGAEQNLRVALEAANYSETGRQNPPEILICILQLLPEDQPLDDHLADMEQASERAIESVGRIVGETPSKAGITLTLLKGMELEAAQLVACQALEWQAGQIYLGLENECTTCQQAKPGRGGFFRFTGAGRKSKKGPAATAPTTELKTVPDSLQPIAVADLTALVTCPIKVTCHGEVLFSLYGQPAKVKSELADL